MDKKAFYPSSGINPALTDTSVSFDPQLPLGKAAGTSLHVPDGVPLPPGVMMLEGGRMRLRFVAGDETSSVTVTVHHVEYEMNRDAFGVFSVEVEGGDGGFCPLEFRVDGTVVLNPMAPVGHGGSRPINYADVPQKDVDFFDLADVPHGSVTQEYYFSKATGLWKSCLVYTPPGYMKDDIKTYPVLYLQHGHGENEQCWVHQGRANFILDNLIAQGKAKPFIVVMNNGMVQKIEDGVRVLDPSKIDALLVEDCIPFIEKTYRARTDKWSRAMAGLSMGSMQTSMVTLTHPERFGYAGVFSGFVRPLSQLINASSYLDALDDKDAFARNYRLFFRACGDRDLLVLERFNGDSDLMKSKGLTPEDCPAHEEVFYPGEHEWNVWRMCLRDFAQKIFRDRP